MPSLGLTVEQGTCFFHEILIGLYIWRWRTYIFPHVSVPIYSTIFKQYVFLILFLFKFVYKRWINKGGDSRGNTILHLKYVTSDSFNVIKLRHTQKLMMCNVAESQYGLQKRSQPLFWIWWSLPEKLMATDWLVT